MQEIILIIIENYGYIGIFSLLCIENLFPPIPSEVILTFGGFMTNYTSLTILEMIVISTLGVIFGAIILYYLGYVLNKDRIIKFSKSRVGKILRIKEENILKSNDWFLNKGYKAVFYCRFIPIVRSLISIPAGMCKMNFLRFIIYTFFGTIIWNSVLIVLGSILGSSWGKIIVVLNKYSKITWIVLIVIFIFLTIKIFIRKKG